MAQAQLVVPKPEAAAQKPAPVPLLLRMALSATGGMGAACCCHPLDVLRVSMQVSTVKRTSIETAQNLMQQNGVRGLYSGIGAAFLRQWTYGSCRVGIYSYLLAQEPKGKPVPLLRKMGFGVISGGIGSFIGTPSELALVRMGADSRLAPGDPTRRGYKNVGDCLMRISKEDGVTGLWKGSAPTIARACVLSATVLGCTSELKAKLPEASGGMLPADGTATLWTATVLASLAATFASQPFDVVKSRIQNMPNPAAGEKPLYSGTLDCARKIIAREGPMVMQKGYTPAFIKLAPYTTISLYLTERLTQLATGRDAL